MPEREASQITRILFPAMGLAEGVAWWLVDPFHLESLESARLGISVLVAVSAASLTARFTFDGIAPIRWASVALGIGILLGCVTWGVLAQLPPPDAPYHGDHLRVAAWMLAASAFFYVMLPFAQVFQAQGRLRFPYADLFEHSWNNFFVGSLAGLFTAVSWVLLGLWGALFNLIDISFFSDLFQAEPFAYIATFTILGYGLALGRASEAVIRTLRAITLMATQALLPVAALIALLFLAALPFTGLRPLWSTGHATPLVLALLGILAVLLNGVFQEGQRRPPYPASVLRAVEAAVFVMPAYAAIALYGTGLRVGQYGLTPERVYALALGGIAMAYSVGYALSVALRKRPWLATLRTVNVAAALLVAALAILLHLPPLDPFRLSVENQVGRLRDQRVDPREFDFAALRFRLGHHGWRALDRLEGLTDHPQIERIARRVEQVRLAETYVDGLEQDSTITIRLVLDTLPETLHVPEVLLAQIDADLGRTRVCRAEGDCLVIGADLDGDGGTEYCVLGGPSWWYSACYANLGAETWERVGQLAYRGPGTRPSLEEIQSALGGDFIRTRPTQYQAIVIPHGALELMPMQR